MKASHLPELHAQLKWPEPQRILDPSGPGPAYYKRLAHLKIEMPLTRILGREQARVSILAGDPSAETSDPPIALICEFNRALTPEHLRKTRALAWNFCRTPVLITLEPHLLRAWSCYEKPDARNGAFPSEPVVSSRDGASLDLTTLADTLHWSRLASGQFLERYSNRFDRNQRADAMLLQNLRYIRGRLTRDSGEVTGLDVGIAHDLLARVVFVQFLFHRSDSAGRAALNADTLAKLHGDGVLNRRHESLSSILMHKGDTFALFKWLNDRFNGDLFPSNYTAEEREVKGFHIRTLADFVSGTMRMEDGQYLLWPHYSFDTIPLEFISSIYEEFVTKRSDGRTGVGEHYTRPFLVDFMLDKVLPWSGTRYDLKILDPCCGSGVFLVKAFQRLVQRWRNAQPGQNPDASFLRSLLEKNLFGVDTNENAVRVASFSLYLAMCDEIDPKHYWTRVRFPSLRSERICNADFFGEDIPGIRTRQDAGAYDLVIGNAPWGEDSLTEEAKAWARNTEDGQWPIADKQAGTLFLAKAAQLCKTDGRICMIQPAGALLFNISGPAKNFRKRLFMRYKVDEIVNLSALRFLNLFPNVVGPACIINMRSTPPDGKALAYWTPKQTGNQNDQVRVIIDEQDLNWIWPEEAADNPTAWPALTWGGRRDLALIQYLKNKFAGIDTYTEPPSERGFERGTKDVREFTDRLDHPVLECHMIWDSLPVVTTASSFPSNDNPFFHRPKLMEVFRLPCAIMKKSWTVQDARFKVVAVLRDQYHHLLFSQSFFGVHVHTNGRLATFTACANSIFAVYYFYLTSGRLASYRPSLTDSDMRQLPMPPESFLSLSSLQEMSPAQIDETVLDLYELNEVHRALIGDFFEVTLQDFKGNRSTPGVKSVWENSTLASALDAYSDWLLRVVQSGFGSDKAVCATIFRCPNPSVTPFCMVGVHLDWARSERVLYENVNDGNLLGVLERYARDNHCDNPSAQTDAIYYHRVSRIYQSLRVKEGRKNVNAPTVFFVKPNQLRYWTRSTALRDADSIVADIMKFGNSDADLREAGIG
jgi:hypothetical protein